MQDHGARASYADRGWKEDLTEDPVCLLMKAMAPTIRLQGERPKCLELKDMGSLAALSRDR